MKNKFRILSIFLLVSLIVSITACNIDNDQGIDREESTSVADEAQQPGLETGNIEAENAGNNDIENSENNANNNQQISNSSGSACIAIFTIVDYSEYEEFLSTHAQLLPSNFITYDQISFLGEFSHFIGHNFYSDNYSKYNYNITDENGYKLVLTIQHLDLNDNFNFNTWNAVLDTTALGGIENLRNINNTENCYTTIDNVNYFYTQGRLSHINWIENDILYTLSGTGMFDNYPIDGKKTLVTQLLTKSEANKAITQVKTAMIKTEEIK